MSLQTRNRSSSKTRQYNTAVFNGVYAPEYHPTAHRIIFRDAGIGVAGYHAMRGHSIVHLDVSHSRLFWRLFPPGLRVREERIPERAHFNVRDGLNSDTCDCNCT